MRPTIRLLIVDDHPVFRRGVRGIVEEHNRFQVIGEASDGVEGLRLAADLEPEIIFIDVDMPQLNGLAMARQLKKNQCASHIVFLTMYKDEDLFNSALDLDVKAYVLKENAGEDIITALLKVSAGETFYSSGLNEIGRKREDRVKSLLLSKPQIDTLTPSERRILKLIAEDRTSKEISDVLSISMKTVENHRSNICRKLDIFGTHSLLKFAFDNKSCL